MGFGCPAEACCNDEFGNTILNYKIHIFGLESSLSNLPALISRVLFKVIIQILHQIFRLDNWLKIIRKEQFLQSFKCKNSVDTYHFRMNHMKANLIINIII